MAKKLFVDGDPGLGTPGTVVNAAWLNKIGDQVPTGEAIDGSSPLLHGTDTGAADAYELDMTFGPGAIIFPQAYVQGLRVSFKASADNTGASTFNVNAISADTIKKNFNEDLVAGDIKTGQIVVLEHDNVNWQLVSQVKPDFVAIRDLYRNLIVKTTGVDTIDVTADEVILQNLNGTPTRVTGVALTMVITNQWTADSAVKNGRGIGINDSVSTEYQLWLVNGSAGSGIVATTETALAAVLADVGAGYNTSAAWLGSVMNDAAADFIGFYQRDNRVDIISQNPLVGGTDIVFTAIDLSPFMPTTAKVVKGMLNQDAVINGSWLEATIAPTIAGTIGAHTFIYDIANNAETQTYFEMMLQEAQTMYYKESSSGSSRNVDIHVHGWEY